MSKDKKPSDRRQSDKIDTPSEPTSERRKEERRKEKRVSVELWVEERDGEDKVFRRTGNLSAGGVYFDKALPHLPGKRLNLKIPLGAGDEVPEVRVWGEVVADGGPDLGMGVKFLSFGGDGEKDLRAFLEEID